MKCDICKINEHKKSFVCFFSELIPRTEKREDGLIMYDVPSFSQRIYICPECMEKYPEELISETNPSDRLSVLGLTKEYLFDRGDELWEDTYRRRIRDYSGPSEPVGVVNWTDFGGVKFIDDDQYVPEKFRSKI